MRCTLSYLMALVLPFPSRSFTITPSRLPCVTLWSSRTKELIPLCCSRRHRRPQSMRMTSQAVDLTNGISTGDNITPLPLPVSSTSSMDTTFPHDRSKLGRHFRLGSKVFNLYGLLFAAQAWLSAFLIFPFCAVAGLASMVLDRRRMRPPTLIALAWGRLVLLTMGVRPTVEGEELLPSPGEAVVFVANHGSYLDIPITNFLPRLCKYLMKAELLWLPIVGWKAVLARDIFVHRQTSETFRRLLVTTTRSLKAGNSIMTFPEGTRSKDGRLGAFKRGPFSMAQRAGVRVVPVSITGVCEAMPPFALTPLRKPQNLRLRIHSPISTAGRSVKDVMAEARRAVSEGLEPWQRPSDLRHPPTTPSESSLT